MARNKHTNENINEWIFIDDGNNEDIESDNEDIESDKEVDKEDKKDIKEDKEDKEAYKEEIKPKKGSDEYSELYPLIKLPEIQMKVKRRKSNKQHRCAVENNKENNKEVNKEKTKEEQINELANEWADEVLRMN